MGMGGKHAWKVLANLTKSDIKVFEVMRVDQESCAKSTRYSDLTAARLEM